MSRIKKRLLINNMKIEKFDSKMILEVIDLWNKNIPNKTIYKSLNKDSFDKMFLSNSNFDLNKTFVYKNLQNNIIGFGNGVINPNNKELGHITFIVIDESYQRKGYGTKLLKKIEEALKDAGATYIRQIFLNPINLDWIIPGTSIHDHPNAPGVDYNSDFYLFLSNNNYILDGDNQDVYYLNIENYHVPNSILERNAKNENEGYNIVLYDNKKHFGFKELFEDLNNELWFDIVKKNLERTNPEPMLIVEKSGEILGWTGPLHTQKSKRGFFAGIGVHSKVRGRGIGTTLFCELISHSKNNGATFMSLFTGSKNPARNIYLNSGFKIIKSFAIMGKKV